MAKLFGVRIQFVLAVLITPLLAGCAAIAPDYAAILTNPARPHNERDLDGARKP